MTLRDQNVQRLDGAKFDVLIVGGGINGAASAAALAARGLSVALVDKGDFASVTSQESSNLVWGGFKYLENYELPLVWKLCSSRNRLMKAYPTRITELGFLATLDKTAPFPALLAGLGAFGYWGIGRCFTKMPKYLTPKAISKAEGVIKTKAAKGGIEYGDGYLRDNDSRFVWNFVRSALDAGAVAVNYVNLDSAEHTDGVWTVSLSDTTPAASLSPAASPDSAPDEAKSAARTGKTYQLTASTIVNAAGPFVDGLNASWNLETKHRIVYSKGIHLVVPRLTDSERVLAFFDDTGRLFYVIPMANRSVIGTTDTRTDKVDEGVTNEDRSFLLDQINARLNLSEPLTESDIIAERCGVRPLVVPNDGDDQEETDWTSLSRKHEVEVDKDRGVVTLFGGKLTDCLNMGEEVVESIEQLGLDVGESNDSWFGEPSDSDRDAFYKRAIDAGFDRNPVVERGSSMAEVLWRRHGLAANDVLDLVAKDEALGDEVLADSDILRAEVLVMADREMIVSVADFLRRRTKLSLIIGDAGLQGDPGMADVVELLGL